MTQTPIQRRVAVLLGSRAEASSAQQVYASEPAGAAGPLAGGDGAPPVYPDVRVPQPPPAFAMRGDIAAALPTAPRKKFKALRDQAQSERRAFESLSSKRAALMDHIAESELQIEAMTLPVGQTHPRSGYSGFGLAEDSAEVRHARMQLASAREDMDEMNARFGDKSSGDLLLLVNRLEEYIQRSARAVSARANETPQLRKGETLPIAIEARRRRLRELDADRLAAARAPWPSSLTKQIARAQIDELYRRGRPDVFALVERGQPVEWPTISNPSASMELPHNIRNPIDATGLIAWALGPALITAVEAEIDELSDDANAMTAEQRREKMAEIAADALAVEREEEALIELAQAEGLNVARRHDADPRAVLGVDGPAPLVVPPIGGGV